MKLVGSKVIFGVLLVPNKRVFRIPVNYVRYKWQQATNHCFPPLYLTFILQFRPILYCILIIRQKQSIPEVKGMGFHQKLQLLTSSDGCTS